MGPNASQYEELYRAAVGESKAHYYVPRFQRFDEGASRASWNWPACFVSFFWMLYRRMYGTALTYWLAWPFVMAILGSIVTVVAGPIAGVITYAVLVLAQLILVPMFANALYHWHIRTRIRDAARGAQSHEAVVERLGRQSGGAPAAVAIAAVGVVFLTGMMAAIAIPAYQDYTIRSQVAEGLNLAASVKAAVAQSYAATGAWPADPSGAGLNTAYEGKYVSGIDVSDGVVVIHFGTAAHPSIAGHTLALYPAAATDGNIEWACGYAASSDASDIQPKYLPRLCRDPTAQVQRL